jgi:hypothetical protein
MMATDDTFAVDRYRRLAGSRPSDHPSRNPLQTGIVSGRSLVRTQPPPTSIPEISMDDEIEIQDLAADEIRELLMLEGSELNEQQAAALKQFIEDIGGMENALAAIAMLDGLEEAA